MTDFDVILVGGGLANGLIADRLSVKRPELRLALIEGGDRIGGNHTWSFHQSDVTPEQDAWLARFVKTAWSEQEVRFQPYTRRLRTGYRSIASEDFAAAINGHDRLAVRLNTPVTELAADRIVLDGGEVLTASCVIDGRGMAATKTDVAGKPAALQMPLGYQKFVGHEVRTREPHGLERPIIMDARVTQHDGYRFIYCLPYAPDVVMIEDTYYSSDQDLDDARLDERISAYAAQVGWEVADTLRTERGVLPIVLDGVLDDVWPHDEPQFVNGLGGSAPPARSGMRAGLFHQTTGYSLPFSAEAADRIAGLSNLTSATAHAVVRAFAEEVWDRQSYFRMLNRMIFVAARPQQRIDIFKRFYRLGEPLIERFYAGHLKTQDKVRILTGWPPVSMARAGLSFAPQSARSGRVAAMIARM